MENLDNSIISGMPHGQDKKVEDVLFSMENNESEFKNLLDKFFKNEAWLNSYLNDDHHGFVHGNQVRLSGLKLIKNLNHEEHAELLREGKTISEDNAEKYATLIVEIASIFHDCGRFNNQGAVVVEEQRFHHVLSADRAKLFCESVGLANLTPYVMDAVLSHDFQSKESTPDLQAPKNITGKIVQSSDQMGWFHPDSVKRTHDYNKAIGNPFYNSEVSVADRLAWKPGTPSKDALTVMLNQLFGPTGADRFGVESARIKVEKYKKELENSIIKIAAEFNLKDEVEEIIEEAKKIYKHDSQ